VTTRDDRQQLRRRPQRRRHDESGVLLAGISGHQYLSASGVFLRSRGQAVVEPNNRTCSEALPARRLSLPLARKRMASEKLDRLGRSRRRCRGLEDGELIM